MPSVVSQFRPPMNNLLHVATVSVGGSKIVVLAESCRSK